MIKILLVDDHQLVRVAMKRILEAEKGLKVVGEADNGKACLELATALKPDVILLDLTMPEMNGFETTRRLTQRGKLKSNIVILTMHDDEDGAARLLRMGIMGYVIKDSAPEELVQAVQHAAEGKRFISATLRESLALKFVDGRGQEPMESLTDREYEILARLASGIPNRDIATELGVSVKTVDAHRLNLIHKLGVRNNTDLTRFAIRNGIINP